MSGKHDRSGEDASKAGIESNGSGAAAEKQEDSNERATKAAKHEQSSASTSASASAIATVRSDTPLESEYLLFAVPKKGRLYEQCCDLLKGAGIFYNRSPRLDIAICNSGLPIKLVFLNAKDIAEFVAEGNIDIGITGQDMVQECGVEVSAFLIILICFYIDLSNICINKVVNMKIL